MAKIRIEKLGMNFIDDGSGEVEVGLTLTRESFVGILSLLEKYLPEDETKLWGAITQCRQWMAKELN